MTICASHYLPDPTGSRVLGGPRTMYENEIVVGGGDDRGRRRDAGSHYVGNVLETTHQNDTRREHTSTVR